MALEISYAPQFFDSLESILNFFDERNGSDRFSKKLLKMISKQIQLLKTMPEIGRLTDTHRDQGSLCYNHFYHVKSQLQG